MRVGLVVLGIFSTYKSRSPGHVWIFKVRIHVSLLLWSDLDAPPAIPEINKLPCAAGSSPGWAATLPPRAGRGNKTPALAFRVILILDTKLAKYFVRQVLPFRFVLILAQEPGQLDGTFAQFLLCESDSFGCRLRN